jgi:small-conductance mechanosensitive channel
MGEQVRFVMTQIIFFLSFGAPLYVINAMGIGLFGYIKSFCLELAALVILARAAIKVHGMQLLVRNRAMSDVSVILMVFAFVVFFIFLYFMHFSYLIHFGIYLSVLYGFFLALRFSIWRADRKEIDHWLFFKLVDTPYGQDLYKFNDGLLKVFSIYILVLMSLVFVQIISNQYQGTINESQLFITGFLLLLTTLAILLAVYAKFGFLKLLERYAHPEMVRFYQQTVMSGVDIITALVAIALALSTTDLWFKNFMSNIFRPEYQDYFRGVSKIAFYLILSRFLWRLIDFSAMKSMAKKKKGTKFAIPSQLRLTITPILRSIGHWLLLTFTVALILEEFGVSILPIIYSISVLGLAISLGAQSLVKDVINGVLTLVEGNIAVGEVVTIGSHTGVVETLSLRGVVLRHSSGALQTIPFSEVTNIINKSRDYCYASIEIPVPFDTKVEDVYQSMELAFKDMQSHPTLSNKILDKLTISGIDRMADGAYYASGSIKIKPDPSGKFIRIFNEYFQKYLEVKGIKPPVLSHS